MNSTLTDNNGRVAGKQRLPEGLGWFSFGLGVPQVSTPKLVNDLIGVPDDRRSRLWQRVVGIRELTAGAGILGDLRPTLWLWARAAGDVMDLALVNSARKRRGSDPRRATAALASLVGVLAADVYAAIESSSRSGSSNGSPVKAKASITVRRPREEVHRRWRELAQESEGPLRFAPIEILADDAPQRIEWRASGADEHPTTGVVRFTDAPGDQGTELHVELQYAAPGGKLGVAVKKLSGNEPQEQIKDDLRRFKQILETGDVVRSQGTPGGHSAAEHLHQRPAQPVEQTV